MMGIMVPETCWASNKICNKNSSVAPSWHFISTYYYRWCTVKPTSNEIIALLSPSCRVFTIIYLEQNHVYRVYSLAGVLYLQLALFVILFRLWYKFCTFTSALPAVFVRCQTWLFFVQFLDFMLSCCVVQMLSEWFGNSSSRRYYYRYRIIIIIILIVGIE